MLYENTRRIYNLILEIDPNHPCKECIVRPICGIDCRDLQKYMTTVYVKISEYIEREYKGTDVLNQIEARSFLLNLHIDKWRANSILKRGKHEPM